MARDDDDDAAALALASGLVVDPGPPAVYVRRCGEGGRCELRLAVRVGSALETEAERGFAHYLEHAAFQATTRYGAGEIVEWLRALGSAYGPDVNASTGVHETVYRLAVALPAGGGAAAEAALREAVGVLREWLHGSRVAAADVDAERGVILQEARNKRGAAQRLRDRYFRRVFADAGGCDLYARRVPIGDVAVVAAATPEALRAFYGRWYTPARAAVVVVGDLGGLDVDRVAAVARAVCVPEAADAQPPSDGAAAPRWRPLVAPPAPVAVVLGDADVHETTVSLECLEPLAPAPASRRHRPAEVCSTLGYLGLAPSFGILVSRSTKVARGDSYKGVSSDAGRPTRAGSTGTRSRARSTAPSSTGSWTRTRGATTRRS